MDWLLILILLAFVAWGLYGLITNERTGARHWSDSPELPEVEDPELKAAAEKWAQRERRKAVGR